MLMQAIRPGVHGAKDGAFRATFEDKPLLSDIVFLRAWVAVDLPRFYNPVTNLLAPAPVSRRAPKPSKVLSFPCPPLLEGTDRKGDGTGLRILPQRDA